MRLAFKITKITMAVLVLVGAMYLFAYPARTYLDQKQAIAVQERAIAVLKAEDSKLAGESSALQSPATIAGIARQKYGLVRPGQQAFMVLPSPGAPASSPVRKQANRRSWYRSLEFWHHL
jgi:cell division protein FtsB